MGARVLTAIITFNPDLDILQKNVSSIRDNDSPLVIVDNNSHNFREIKLVLQGCLNTASYYVIHNNINMGIGYALNQALDYAQQNKYDWLLTLDQDSVCENDYITTMQKYIAMDVGLICPAQIKDAKWSKTLPQNNWINKFIVRLKKIFINQLYEAKIYCPITSGSLMNVSAVNNVGGYDSDMFIDGIDFDVDLKLQKTGYKIVVCYEAKLNHNLGCPDSKSFLGINIVASGHSPERIYYMNRNSYRLLCRYGAFVPRWCIGNVIRSIIAAIKNAFVSGRYMEYGSALLQGICDGIVGKKIRRK